MAAPTTPKRVRLDPDLRRERLIASASELFERHPYDQLTTQQLAAGCGVSEGLIYHYFGSKRGLYVACLERNIDEFVGSIEDPGPAHPLDQRLRRALDSYLDFVELHPRSYASVLRGGIGMDHEVHALTEQARERFCDFVVRGLGIEDPSPGFLVAIWGWMGFVEGACTRWLQEQEISRDDLHDLLLATTLATFTRALAA
jgi:AcrR family transcriptional regulator